MKTLKFVQLIALLFLVMVTGVFWGPWLGLHRTLSVFSQAELIHIVQVLAQNLAGPMQVIMSASVLLLTIAAWLYPDKKQKEFYFNIISILLVIASVLISVLIELPIVDEMKTWTLATIPPHWEAMRDRWVFYHVIRLLIAFAGLTCFGITMLQPFRKTNKNPSI